MNKNKIRKGYFKEAKIKKYENGAMDLELPEIPEKELKEKLPNVSIITITKNRGVFAGIMLYNWVHIKYPREKLEWLILDDSCDKEEYNLRDYIPEDDPYIRYVKLDREYAIDEKRNLAVKMAKYNYIIHMDDDDYYFPDGVLAKIRLLLDNPDCDGILSLPIGVYDMMEGTSFIFDSKTPSGKDTNDVPEASLAYKKEYWLRNKFQASHEYGLSEGRAFINNNFKKWINLHFLFNIVSITHSKNITGNNRRFFNENIQNFKTGNFEDVFPDDFKTTLHNIRNILKINYKHS